MRKRRFLVAAVMVVGISHPAYAQPPSQSTAWCTGDCNRDDRVAVSELIRLFNIELGNASCSSCPDWCSPPCNIECFRMIEAVNHALYGCRR